MLASRLATVDCKRLWDDVIDMTATNSLRMYDVTCSNQKRKSSTVFYCYVNEMRYSIVGGFGREGGVVSHDDC